MSRLRTVAVSVGTGALLAAALAWGVASYRDADPDGVLFGAAGFPCPFHWPGTGGATAVREGPAAAR